MACPLGFGFSIIDSLKALPPFSIHTATHKRVARPTVDTRTQIPINVYSTKNTSRLLVGCHTQASGYFWGGNSTDLSFGGPPLSIGPKLP